MRIPAPHAWKSLTSALSNELIAARKRDDQRGACAYCVPAACLVFTKCLPAPLRPPVGIW